MRSLLAIDNSPSSEEGRVLAPKLNAFREFDELPVPKGHTDNSPAFQRWVVNRQGTSPEGTADAVGEAIDLRRPAGTLHSFATVPALKRRAILACPFGTAARQPSESRKGIMVNPCVRESRLALFIRPAK